MTATGSAAARRLRLALVLVLLAVLIVRVALNNRPDPSLRRVQEAGVLVVAFDASYPPFEMTDGEGNFGGLDADLARAIAERLGVAVQFANVSFDSLYDALAARQADVVISGLRYEAERTRDVIYTTSYFDAGQTLIVRAGDAAAKPADLAHRRVAVELASEGEVEARRLATKIAGMQVQAFATLDDATSALAAGIVDAVAADNVTALELVGERAALRLLQPPFAPDPLVIAGHAHDRTLMNEISRLLRGIQEDDTLAQLTDKWFRRP
jgi:polar amino acid transport system substrate-binding protein